MTKSGMGILPVLERRSSNPTYDENGHWGVHNQREIKLLIISGPAL